MKKITLLVAGLMVSGMASAVQFSSSGLLTQTQCANLNENVSINLTTGVVAGVTCATGRVGIAACATNGMVKSRQALRVPVKSTVSVNGVDTEVTTETPCTAGTTGCREIPVTGAALAGASTVRGTTNTVFPNAGACTVGLADTTSANTTLIP